MHFHAFIYAFSRIHICIFTSSCKIKNVMHSSNKRRSNLPEFKHAFSLRKLDFMHLHMHHSSSETQFHALFIIRNSNFHSPFIKRNSKFHATFHSSETQSFHSFKHTFIQKEKLKVFIHSNIHSFKKKKTQNFHTFIHAYLSDK